MPTTNEKIYEMLFEACSEIKILRERFDRHIPEQKADIKNIYSKLDVMTNNQHKNKEELILQIHENNLAAKTELTALGVKVAMGISAVVTSAGLFLKWALERIKAG